MLTSPLPSVRQGLTAMLAAYGHTVAHVEDAPADAVWVVDLTNPRELDELLARADPAGPPAVVALADDARLAHRLVSAGLRGWACLPRDVDARDLDLAVRAADAGFALLEAQRLIAGFQPPAMELPENILTPREVEVLQLVARGLPNKGIARMLGMSENTAKFHVAALCAKLGAANRAEAVRIGARFGLVVL
jgi:DNA-binding NarL/FixJ family response regulator